MNISTTDNICAAGICKPGTNSEGEMKCLQLISWIFVLSLQTNICKKKKTKRGRKWRKKHIYLPRSLAKEVKEKNCITSLTQCQFSVKTAYKMLMNLYWIVLAEFGN